jgi:broad specificity phosphatase PhoE
MSLLLMVRHGQASFLTDNYDRLSERGEKQIRRLGEYWCEQDLTLDGIYSGTLKRQVDSAEIIRQVYLENGRPCPENRIVPELNEYQAEEFLYHHLDDLCEIDPALKSQYLDFQGAQDERDRFRTYQKMFETAMHHWLAGEIGRAEVETWRQFVSRVESGIRTMTEEAISGNHIAAFTSGGTIGVAMQYALKTSPEMTLQVSWMLRNASLTTFLFTQGRFTLSTFNETPHLLGQEWWTYR